MTSLRVLVFAYHANENRFELKNHLYRPSIIYSVTLENELRSASSLQP